MLAMAAVAMSPWLLPSSPHTSFNVAAVLLAPAFLHGLQVFNGFAERFICMVERLWLRGNLNES